jgi:soluble lytic murein transglycosylase-like protein
VPRFSAVLVLLTLGLPVTPAVAQSFRFVAPDGTVHITNAPNDPRYQRMGLVSGTQSRWLSLPAGSQRYAAEIAEVAGRYGVPQRLVEAVIRVESAFNPAAVSRKGARGLMQLMPGTASVLGVRDAFNPRQNIDGGVRHLRGLMDRYPNNLPLAIAAYNAGEQAVDWYRGIPPYPETRQYVQKVLSEYGVMGAVAVPRSMYRYEDLDGTVTYTNVPRSTRR